MLFQHPHKPLRYDSCSCGFYAWFIYVCQLKGVGPAVTECIAKFLGEEVSAGVSFEIFFFDVAFLSGQLTGSGVHSQEAQDDD